MDVPGVRQHRLVIVAAIIVVVTALHLARELLMPFALALVLSVLLVPAVDWLERLRLGRIAPVVIAIVLTCAVLGVILWFVTQQITDLVTKLPEYREHIVDKVDALRGGALEKASDAVKQLGEDIETATEPEPKPEPQEVKVVAPDGVEALAEKAGVILGPLGSLGTLGLVLVIATFFLLQRNDLRDRIVHLIGQARVNVTTQAMDEVYTRVSKYLLMNALVNSLHGAAVGIGLFVLDVPNALVWGLLSALLRFIPYLGPVLAAVLPCALSLAVFDGWSRPLMVIGFFIFIELLSNNVLEPWLYGQSAGVSPFAVIAAAVFWAWLWGPIGLFLATPLTVFLVVAGKHVPQLRFLNVLLGQEPSIDPAVRVYQRMLAMDRKELGDLTRRALAEEKSFVQVCDTILIPALRMAEIDRHHGDLEVHREDFIQRTMRELIDDLGERDRDDRGSATDAAAAARQVVVLCMPAKHDLEHVVALMLCQALADIGIACHVASAEVLASEKAALVEELQPAIVCISALPPTGLQHARYLGKRLRARFPDLELVVGLWGDDLDAESGVHRLRITPPCEFATTLAAARDTIQQLVLGKVQLQAAATASS